ncbi:MAG: NTP transferase domain-containing protein [bacterium]
MKSNISSLILTAGLSTRMGEFKPLLKFNNITFLENIINKILLVSEEIIIVTGYRHKEIECLIFDKYDNNPQIKIVYNAQYDKPMFVSLQTGLQEVNNNNWVLYHFIDQPIIPQEFYSQFINQIDMESEFIQPTYKTKKGHPLLFNFKFAKHLLNSDITSNLRDEIWKTDLKKKYWECIFPQILKDFDTPDDYNKIYEV